MSNIVHLAFMWSVDYIESWNTWKHITNKLAVFMLALNFIVCDILLGVKGVQVEEMWSFDPESFSQIK